MSYPPEQIEGLRPYCRKISALPEGGGIYLFLEDLKLPEVCEPKVSDALLRPFPGPDGYPSQLYFAQRIALPYGRNWNVIDARICEKNWFAFSWKRTSAATDLVQILKDHLASLTQRS